MPGVVRLECISAAVQVFHLQAVGWLCFDCGRVVCCFIAVQCERELRLDFLRWVHAHFQELQDLRPCCG